MKPHFQLMLVLLSSSISPLVAFADFQPAEGKLVLSLTAGEAVSIVPSSASR